MADDERQNTPLLNALAQVTATIYAARLARGEAGAPVIVESANDAVSVMLAVIDATRDLDEMLRALPAEPGA